jgi:hypothetical protein
MNSVCEEEVNLPRLNIVGRTLTSERGVSLVVVIMLMVVILAITGAGLLLSSIDLRISSNYRAGAQTFNAADVGVGDGIARTGIDPITIPKTPLDGGLFYCGGSLTSTNRCASPPLASQFISLKNAPEFTLGNYYMYQYQLNVTATGPMTSAREIEAQVEYGPVPK